MLSIQTSESDNSPGWVAQHDQGRDTDERDADEHDAHTEHSAQVAGHGGRARSRPLRRTTTPGIYKRGSRYVVVFRDPHGRQHKRAARTLAEARELKATLTADVARGEYRALSRVRFDEYATEWVEQYTGRTRRGLREETRADYRRAIERHAIPYFGRTPLAAIEPRDVKRFATHVTARGVAPNTVRLTLAPVKALLATAVEDGLIRSNPAMGVRIAQPEADEAASARKVMSLTADELRALVEQMPAEYRLLVQFLASTGLRISEALALTWGDIDFGRRRVEVRRRLYRGKIGPTKTSYGRRDVPVSVTLAQQLWTMHRTAGSGTREDMLVFTRRDGKPLDRTHAFRVVKAAGKRAGVPWVGLHTLRHTAATLAFRHGWNAKQVQALLGHHSPAFTLATYVHLLDDDLPDPTFLDSVFERAGTGDELHEDGNEGRYGAKGTIHPPP